jgi:hypothetical protein
MAQRLIIPPDDFDALFTKFNVNAGLIPASINVTTNGTVEQRNDEDALLTSYESGGAAGHILEGLIVSEPTNMSDPLSVLYVSVSGGAFAWQNQKYLSGEGNYALEPPDILYPRIDVVRANQNGVSVLTGTAAEFPQPPNPDGIALAYLIVTPNGSMIKKTDPSEIKSSPLYIDVDGGSDTQLPNNRTLIVIETGVELYMPTQPIDGLFVYFRKRTEGNVDLFSAYPFEGVASPYTLSQPIRVFVFSAERAEWIVL